MVTNKTTTKPTLAFNRVIGLPFIYLSNYHGAHAPHKWRACTTQVARTHHTSGAHAPHKWRACTTQMARMHHTNGAHAPHKWRACTTQMARMHRTNASKSAPYIPLN